MELKYKTSDVWKMVDAMVNLTNKHQIKDVTFEDLVPLLDYPTEVIQEFLKAVGDLKEVNKDNIQGVIGYIVIRLNLAIM